jgi:hypothetical protein
MKARTMIYILALMGFTSLAASAQSVSAVVVPAIASIPVIARLATAKKLPMPQCNGEVLVHKNNAIVCATPGIDWAAYGKIDIAPVEVVPQDSKRPLTEQEVARLTNTLSESLQRRFGHPEAGTASGAATRKLMLRAQVMEVRRTNKALNIFTMAVIQAPVSFGGASAHFEFSDAASGQVLAQIDLSDRGRLYDAFSSARTLGHAQKVLNRMPKQLDKNLKTLRSNSNALQTAVLKSPGSAK